MAALKIGDLLDFSSLPGTSTSPSSELPRPKGTVHHHPSHYVPHNKAQRRSTNHRAARSSTQDVAPDAQRRSTNQRAARSSTQDKRSTTTEEDVRCPNVLVRNGVLCKPYRPPEQGDRRDGERREGGVIRETKDRGRGERGGGEQKRREEKCTNSKTKKNQGKKIIYLKVQHNAMAWSFLTFKNFF